MYIYLFLWYFSYGKKLLKMEMIFLCSVNVYVFIPMVLFIIKNCQKSGFYLVLMYMYLFL